MLSVPTSAFRFEVALEFVRTSGKAQRALSTSIRSYLQSLAQRMCAACISPSTSSVSTACVCALAHCAARQHTSLRKQLCRSKCQPRFRAVLSIRSMIFFTERQRSGPGTDERKFAQPHFQPERFLTPNSHGNAKEPAQHSMTAGGSPVKLSQHCTKRAE